MSMKEQKFLERQEQEAETRKEAERQRHNARRADALTRNARDVYDHDRDFPGDFSDER